MFKWKLLHVLVFSPGSNWDWFWLELSRMDRKTGEYVWEKCNEKSRWSKWLIFIRISFPLYERNVICTKCYLCFIIILLCGLSSLPDWSSYVGIAHYRKQNRIFLILSAPTAINCIHLMFNMCLLITYSMLGTMYYRLEIMKWGKKAWFLSSWNLQSGGWNRYSNDHINDCMIINFQKSYDREGNSAVKAYSRGT